MVIRAANPGDAPFLTRLIGELGYEVADDVLIERLARLASAGERVLVAEQNGRVTGLITVHPGTHVLHRPRPVGRITMLVVATIARGSGVGRRLVQEAERIAHEAGCGWFEVTSNLVREDAHAFYERLGFARTSYRFGKDLSTS